MIDIFCLKVHNSQHRMDNTESRDLHIKGKDILMATDADKDDHSPDVPIGTKTVDFNEDNTADMNIINMIDPTLINSFKNQINNFKDQINNLWPQVLARTINTITATEYPFQIIKSENHAP